MTEKIAGYRELSESEIRLINDIKDLAEEAGRVVKSLDHGYSPGEIPDPRWVAIGKAELQKGFMSLVRSVAKPESF